MHSTRENSLDASERLLLKADEVARRLSLGRATVYLMMASGELPILRKGRAVRVPARALEQWIERKTQPGEVR
jgi:excisionase family DNA binding protein